MLINVVQVQHLRMMSVFLERHQIGTMRTKSFLALLVLPLLVSKILYALRCVAVCSCCNLLCILVGIGIIM